MNINVGILEDNPITARDLSEILEENNISVIKVFATAEEALRQVDQLPIDVWMVDVKLKGDMTGIDFVRALNEAGSCPYVFLTANSDRQTIDEVISTHPASFLTKPFDDKDVVIAIELAFRKSLDQQTPSGQGQKKLSFVFLKSGTRFIKVPLEQIQYLEADGSYCKVVTVNKEYILSCNLNHFSTNVNNGDFLRIHKSFAVNLDCITGMDNDYIFVEDKPLPIGRVYKTEVKQVLKRFS